MGRAGCRRGTHTVARTEDPTGNRGHTTTEDNLSVAGQMLRSPYF